MIYNHQIAYAELRPLHAVSSISDGEIAIPDIGQLDRNHGTDLPEVDEWETMEKLRNELIPSSGLWFPHPYGEPKSEFERHQISAFEKEYPRVWSFNIVQSAFERIDRDRDYDAKLAEICESFSRDLGSQLGEWMASRISTLAKIEDDDDVVLNLESVGCLFRFLAQNKKMRRPALGVTPSGSIYAQWRKTANNKFSVEFLPDGRVYFVLFVPSQVEIAHINRVTGLEFVDSVIGNLNQYEVERLITNVELDSF